MSGMDEIPRTWKATTRNRPVMVYIDPQTWKEFQGICQSRGLGYSEAVNKLVTHVVRKSK